MGGYLRGWLRNESIEQCCRPASACGAIVVSQHGCASAMPTSLRQKRNRDPRSSVRPARSGTPVSSVVPRPAPVAISRLGPRFVGANTVAAAVAGTLYCAGGIYAQAQVIATATPASEISSLDEIVITASATALKKLDASYQIVSIDSEMIKDANPKSTADLLKLSPGIWPESSGGQTGANIEIAGIPSGGDAPFRPDTLFSPVPI